MAHEPLQATSMWHVVAHTLCMRSGAVDAQHVDAGMLHFGHAYVLMQEDVQHSSCATAACRVLPATY